MQSIPVPVSLNSKGFVCTGNTNDIFGYKYACHYIVTAHLRKNELFSADKVNDKEFVIHINESIIKRDDPCLHYEKNDPSLLCISLNVHAVKSMRDHKFSKGGALKNSVFVRVFTKKERYAIPDSEMPREMERWMGRVQNAFLETRSRDEECKRTEGVSVKNRE